MNSDRDPIESGGERSRQAVTGARCPLGLLLVVCL